MNVITNVKDQTISSPLYFSLFMLNVVKSLTLS